MRDIASGALTALASGRCKGALLVFMDLAAGPLRLCSGSRSVVADGYTWQAVGTLGSVDAIADKAGEADRQTLKLTLSAVSSDTLVSALTASVRDRDLTMTMAVLSEDTEAVLDTVPLAAAKMAQAPITRGAGTRTVSIIASHLADFFSKPKPFRNTDADQRLAYTDDTSRRFLLSQAQKQDAWPSREWFAKRI